MKSKLVLFCIVSFLTSSFIQAKVQTVKSVQSDIFYEIARGSKKSIKTWLESKPDLSIRNDKGQTVIHVAALTGQRDLVKMFVKAGAVINAVDFEGKTALDHAVEFGHEKSMFYLLKTGAKVTNQHNLMQAQSIIFAYNKKIMRRFYILLPIALVLVVPLFLCCATATLPVVSVLHGVCVCFTFFIYIPGSVYMLTLPVQASAWAIRSCRLKVLESIEQM